MYHTTYDSPVGTLYLQATNTHLTRVSATALPTTDADGAQNLILTQAIAELAAYFAGRLRTFAVPYQLPDADSFRNQVHRVLATIPHGEVRTYTQMAMALDNPGATRAVGSACAANPLLLIVPCHRVVRQDGSPGEYAGGRAMKRYLLELEGVSL